MNFIKCNITTARKLYNKGVSIYLVPSNVYPNFNNNWVKPFEINKKNYDDEWGNFDNHVNAFYYYNCNDAQTGLRAHYYYLED